MRETSTDSLDQVAGERHTSRSGFISFYSPDWRTWGDVTNWDHNQLRNARGNGRLEDWIADNTPGIDRLRRIHDYLRAREARA
jgi:hypothetical protein